MRKFIIKYKILILVISLFLIITSYDNRETKLTQEEKVLQIKKSLDKTEQGIIEINKILDNPYKLYEIKNK